MTAVPVTRTFVAGEVVLASYFNTNINGPLGFLLAKPIFQGRQTAAQSLTNGASTAITMDAEDVDSANGHSLVTNTSRYTAVYPGWYSGSPGVSYAANATGQRSADLAKNGTVINGGAVLLGAFATLSTRVPGRKLLAFLNVNDYLEGFGFQNSGGALNTAVTTVEQPTLVVEWESN